MLQKALIIDESNFTTEIEAPYSGKFSREKSFAFRYKNDNFAEKTFMVCSGTSNYYVGVATTFFGENFCGWF